MPFIRSEIKNGLSRTIFVIQAGRAKGLPLPLISCGCNNTVAISDKLINVELKEEDHFYVRA